MSNLAAVPDPGPAIPTVPTRTKTVRIAGVAFTIRSLSRTESNHILIGFHVEDMADLELVEERAAACERYILAKGLGVTEDEAETWRGVTDGNVVGELIDAISIYAGLAPEQVVKGKRVKVGPDPQ